MRLRLGISPCPNDTFTFHGLLSGAIEHPGLDLEFELLDIQELNERLRADSLDVAKASFHAALHLAGRYGVLPVGSALGFGVGPLLLATTPRPDPSPDDRILCPGADTTATLLLRCLYPTCRRLEHRNFAEIMPALQAGEAEYGVVIHEGRFVSEREGLHRVRDLGALWEERTASPVPLGGLLARLSLGTSLHRRVTEAVRASLDHALAHRDEARETMRRHAQELDDAVIDAHVDLYVNECTRDLGSVGRRALAALGERARAAGLLAPRSPPLRILD